MKLNIKNRWVMFFTRLCISRHDAELYHQFDEAMKALEQALDSCSDIDLSGANLRRADLRHADLRAVDLSRAELSDVVLSDAGKALERCIGTTTEIKRGTHRHDGERSRSLISRIASFRRSSS
jgi:hypothetical protein